MLNTGWDDDSKAVKTLRFHMVLECTGFRGAGGDSIWTFNMLGLFVLVCFSKEKKQNQHSTVTVNLSEC